MSNYVFEIKHIQKLLAELNAMDPLPGHGTPEALADHDGWMKRHDQVIDIVRHAEQYAMLALPAEVSRELALVEARMRVLLNIAPLPGSEEK